MAFGDWYIGEDDAPAGLGDIYYLLAPQLATSSGGGANFLGAVLKREKSGGRHPVPRLYTYPPRVVMDRLNALFTQRPIELEQVLAGFTQSMKRDQGLKLNLGVDQIPGLPVALGVKVDYSDVDEVAITYAMGTRVLYLPVGLLNHMAVAAEGDAQRVHPDLADGDYICDTIILAKSYSVAVTKKSSLDVGFDATMTKAIDGVKAGLSINYTRTGNNAFSIAIASSVEYLVGLGVVRWPEINPL